MRTKLFDWALPKFLRKRARTEPEEQDRRLASVPDTDPVLIALTQELHEQFEEEVLTLLNNTLGQGITHGSDRQGSVNMAVAMPSAGAMEYQRGRAAGMYALLLRLETQREAARDEVRARKEREAKQRK